jgi:hypothetical protein
VVLLCIFGVVEEFIAVVLHYLLVNMVVFVSILLGRIGNDLSVK